MVKQLDFDSFDFQMLNAGWECVATILAFLVRSIGYRMCAASSHFSWIHIACLMSCFRALRYPCVAEDVNRLRRKVQVGSYKPIPTTHFSKDLVNLIHSMLSLDAEKRPTAASICNTKWLFDFCLDDIQSFAGSTGGFEEEVNYRLACRDMVELWNGEL